MPRVNYQYSDYAIKALLDKVREKSMVRVCCISDCINLASALADSGVFLSEHTIARLFRIVKTTSRPSRYTLDKLAEYVGARNWDTFFAQVSDCIDQSIKENPVTEDINWESEISLVKYCLHDYAYNPLFNYLNRNLDLFTCCYNCWGSKAVSIFTAIDDDIVKNPIAQKNLLPFIARNDTLRRFYFNNFVDTDGLNTYLAKFLEKEYIVNLNPYDDFYKNDLVWAYSMLITAAAFANDRKRLLRYCHELFRIVPPSDFVFDPIHEWVYARYQFAHILYLYYSGNGDNSVFSKKIDQIQQQIEKTDHSVQITVMFQVFESLTIAQKPEIILQFSDGYKKILKSIVENDIIIEYKNDCVLGIIYYYMLALSSCNKYLASHNQFDAQTFRSENYQRLNCSTNMFYYNSLHSLLSKDPESKRHYIQSAYEHARRMRSKPFIKQVALISQ